MNCSRAQKLIALYVGDDASGRKSRRVETHLEACAACREFAARLQASQNALRELRGEAVDEAVLRQIRQQVLARVGRAGYPLGGLPRWRWAYALAAALMLAAGVWFLPRREPPVPMPRKVARTPAAPLAAPAARPVPMQAVARVRKRARRKPRRPVSSQPLLVKFETSDPNVVIYWIVDRNGG